MNYEGFGYFGVKLEERLGLLFEREEFTDVLGECHRHLFLQRENLNY